MKNKIKDYVTFFFNDYLYRYYYNNIKNDYFNYCFDLMKMFDYENENNLTLLVMSEDANVFNNNKLAEMKILCNLFSDEYFYFLSGDKSNGVCFKFDSQINKRINQEDKDLFFSYLLPYNFWLTPNWCRWVSGGTSDIKIGKNTFLNFNHELIVSKKENFDKIKEIYEKKYGEIIPLIKQKKKIKRIFESEFKCFLSDKIYITHSSIDYITNQLEILDN